MRRAILPVFFQLLLVCFTVNAQDSTLIKKDSAALTNPMLYSYTGATLNTILNSDFRSNALNRISADFNYFTNSNVVPAAFGLKFIFKGDIPKSLIDRVDNRLGSTLKLEDNLQTGITYQRRLPKWGGTIYFTYQHRQMRNISGPKDLYEMIFYGNAHFEGDTADLSNLRFQNIIYNQYGAGVKKMVNFGKYQVQLGVGLAFLQVINNQDVRTNHASIYTAPDGEYLDINYDLTFNNARDGATKYGQLNGAGVSADFNLAVMNSDKWKLALDISDIGSVTFNTAPVNYSGINQVHFQGIAIPDLTSFSSQTFDTLSVDSAVRSNLPKKTNNAYAVALPFTATLIFSKPLAHNRLVLNAALQYKNIRGYYLYAYLKANYFIKPDMVFSASVAGGGYSLFNVGAEFAKRWKYFDFALGTGNLIGLILPSNYTGLGLYARVAATF